MLTVDLDSARADCLAASIEGFCDAASVISEIDLPYCVSSSETVRTLPLAD